MTPPDAAAITPLRFVIVGHDIASNALGRAISMALVAQQLGSTSLFAFGGDDVWKGVEQFDVPVERLSGRWRRELEPALQPVESVRTVVWLAKGISPLDKVARFVAGKYPDALILLDLDDDDAGLADAFVRRSLLNRMKLHPFRRGHAARVRKSQWTISKLADAFTFSTHSLSEVYPPSFKPKTRVPHVRRDVTILGNARHDEPKKVRFGSFGTLRPHKGSGLLLDLMRHDRSMTLVTFANCGLGTPEVTDTNWIELPSDTPLSEAYACIDVSLIAITENSSGARYQLPAKLIDSMQSGVPILASATPAIVEIAGDAFTQLDLDLPLESLGDQIKEIADTSSGLLGRDRFERILTPSAAASVLSELIQDVVSHRNDR